MTIFILSVSPEIYSTDRIFAEFEHRGHAVRVINHLKCTIQLHKGKSIILYNDENIIDQPDVIIPRIGVTATRHGSAIVKEFELNGVFTTASSSGIIHSQNKASTLQLMNRKQIPIPKTVFSVNSEDIDKQFELLNGMPIIIKLQEGTHGMGVMLAESKKSAKSIIDTMYGTNNPILLQEFIKESKGEDVRAIVAGNRVIGSMKRKGAKNDFRSNIHRGGSGEEINLTEEEKNLAIQVAKYIGLPVAGVDIIRSKRGPLLLEVNSTPGLQGIEEFTNSNVAERIVKFVEYKYNSFK